MATTSRKRKALSAEAIVSIAVELADAGGMESVSMRTIAARLSYHVMSLYYYVPDKQALVSLMVDSVMQQHHYPDPGDLSWRERLHTAAQYDWDMYMTHPWLLDSVATMHPPYGPETLVAAEWVLDALALIKLPLPAAGLAISTINHYIQGSARVALSTSGRSEASDDQDPHKVWQARLRDQDLDAFPRLQELVATELAPREKSRFEAGLDLILDGIARQGVPEGK